MTEDEFRTHMLLLGLRVTTQTSSFGRGPLTCVDSIDAGWAVCVFAHHSDGVDWDKLHAKVQRHLHKRGIEK